MKSKCCGADIEFKTIYGEMSACSSLHCKKCERPCEACDLTPALRDSKEVLKFVTEQIETCDICLTEGKRVPIGKGLKGAIELVKKQLELTKNFIEGKE